MKAIRLYLISAILPFVSFASSFTEIKSSIKAYDFINADTLIENYLQSSPASVNPEIYILKCINEIALAFEDETPRYLIENFNAVEARAYSAFDLSGNGVELSQIPLIIDSRTVGYWYDPTNGNFPTNHWDSEENAINSLIDWKLESVVTNPFSQNISDGPYYYGNVNGEAISFEFKADNNSSQTDFIFEASHSNYSSRIKIYLNGQDIGYVYSDYYYLYDRANSYSWWNDEDYYWNNSNEIIQLPLYLEPGDIVTFQYIEGDSDSMSKIGVMPVNPFLFEAPENGKSYYNSTPDIEDNITIENVLSFFVKGDAPARTLLRTLVSEIDNFISSIESWSSDSTILGHSFTGFNSNILIQKSDAIAIKSILEIIDVFAGIINQYDLSINLSDSIFEDEDELYNSTMEFLDAYQLILSQNNTSENATDQLEAKNRLNTALTSLENILQVLWYRGSPDYPTDSYLIETSSSSNSGELEETKKQLTAFKNTLNGYEKTSALNDEVLDGGASVSLMPFLDSDSPLNLRQLAYELSGSSETRTMQILNQYGFLKDYLPNNFDGKILVFYNSNNDINSTILLNKDNRYDFDPIDGELSVDNFSNGGYSTIDFSNLILSHNSNYSGEWQSYGYYNYNLGEYINPLSGYFYFYDSLLDLNQNGRPDAIDLYNDSNQSNNGNYYNRFIFNNLNYISTLSDSFIQGYQINRYPTPSSLKGFIALEADENEYYNYSNGMYEIVNEIDAAYFISNDDCFEIDNRTSNDMDMYNTQFRITDVENYKIEGDIITFTDTLNRYNHYGNDQSESNQLFFIDQYTYMSLDIDDEVEEMGNDFNTDINYGVIYPAYLDLDKDGLPDGVGMKAQITPKFDRLPTSYEIQEALNLYNSGNNSGTDPDEHESGEHESSTESIQNPNALTDIDGDNMPDALELRYGGDTSDPNDATISLNQILSVDRYTLSEIKDLRLGSTLYEISQGVASFNIILEESTDLVNWVQHEPMQLDLGQQSDESSKFYRFKMDD